MQRAQLTARTRSLYRPCSRASRGSARVLEALSRALGQRRVEPEILGPGAGYATALLSIRAGVHPMLHDATPLLAMPCGGHYTNLATTLNQP